MGFFLGVIMVMAQQMLIIFAIFVDRSGSTDDDDTKAAEEATASFSFFLFVIYVRGNASCLCATCVFTRGHSHGCKPTGHLCDHAVHVQGRDHQDIR